MKKKDVKIGGKYAVKVSGQIVPVIIVWKSRFGGWVGVNTRTGREVKIKTAQRLRYEWTSKENLAAVKISCQLSIMAGGKVRTAYPSRTRRTWIMFDMDECRGLGPDEMLKRLYKVHF